jgi:hypothetical protein
MALHLARSDGGKGGREKSDDQIVFPVILIRIVDQPVLRGWQGKIEYLPTDQLYFFCGLRIGKEKKR